MVTKNPRRGQGEAIAWLRDHVAYAEDGCLTWPFSRNPEKGYGVLGYLGRNHYAHRLICELAHGPAPIGKPQASHSCGKGHEGCVNQRHLSWATNTENQLDRRRHGTQRGAVGWRTRLPAELVAKIRELKGTMTQRQIAEAVGVKVGTVEYWHKHDRPPAPLSTEPWAVERRRRQRI